MPSGLELVAQDAAALALGLLGTDPAGDRRQDVVLADLGRGLQVVSRDDELDEVLDLHPDRAARHALGRGALEAAQRLGRRPQDGQALVDLLEVRPPQLGRLLGHVLAGNLDPLLVRQRLGRRGGAHELWASQERTSGCFCSSRHDSRTLSRSCSGCSRNRWSDSASCLRYFRLRWIEEVEIDLVGVELGPVDAGELGPLRREHAAAAAHAGAVDHQRVEAHHGLDPVRPGRLGDGLHHPRRPDRQHEVDLPARLDQLLELVGHEALAAVAAVVGRDQELVADRADLLLEDHQLLVPGARRSRSHGCRPLSWPWPSGRRSPRRRRRRSPPRCRRARRPRACPAGRRGRGSRRRRPAC